MCKDLFIFVDHRITVKAGKDSEDLQVQLSGSSTLISPLNRVPKCHTHMSFEHFQGW